MSKPWDEEEFGGDLLDRADTISLDDDEAMEQIEKDGEFHAPPVARFEDGFANLEEADDGNVPFDPFALNNHEADFWADDAAEYDVEGDPNAPVQESYTPSIDEGDFLDPAQRFLFKRLKQRIREACNINSKGNERSRALEWLFVPETKDKDSLQFDLTCRALGARPLIMRARTMHQLWKANIMLSEPLPFLSAIPPQSLISEIEARIGPGAPGEVAREVWYWPSIPVEVLRSRFRDMDERKYHAALASLDALGYTAIAFGRVYFISRNPAIMAIGGRNRFAFATSIYGDS